MSLPAGTGHALCHGCPIGQQLGVRLAAAKGTPGFKDKFRTAAKAGAEQELGLLAKRQAAIPRFLVSLFAAGAILGPPLDGIHGTVHLLNYKACSCSPAHALRHAFICSGQHQAGMQVAAFDIGGLHSSLWVPPLLGAFYAIIGSMHTLGDSLATGSFKRSSAPVAGLQSFLGTTENTTATASLQGRVSMPYVALTIGVSAALLYLSAVLYERGLPYSQISGVLAVAAVVNWRVFDQTRQGLMLAVLCTLAAPASELVIINAFGLWQYPRPDAFGIGGVPHWIMWCYFFYTAGLGNLARLLWKQIALND